MYSVSACFQDRKKTQLLPQSQRGCADFTERAMKLKSKKIWIWIVVAIFGISLLGAGAVFGTNAYVVYTADDYILSPEQAAQLQDV